MTNTEPTVTISLPGSFCAWFDGTNLVQGGDDRDPDCKEMREAYQAGRRVVRGHGYSVVVTANRSILLILAEYAGHCLMANIDEPNPSERAAANLLIRRVYAAIRTLG